MVFHPKAPRAWSVRARLLLLVLSVWLPAMVAFALLARTTYQREEAMARQGMRDKAEGLNAAVEAELDKRAVLARTLAASIALRENDIVRFHREAAHVSDDSGSAVFLVDRQRLLANTRTPAPQALARLGDAPFVEAGPPRVYFASRGTLRQQPVLAVFTPESGVQPPRYNVGVSLEPAVIQHVLSLHPAMVPGEGSVSVVDRQHLVIARSRDPDAGWAWRRPGR